MIIFIFCVTVLATILMLKNDFELVRVPGDGLCFYYAFQKHLQAIYHSDKTLSVRDLKQKIYRYALQHYPQKNMILNLLNPKDTKWATDEIIMLVSEMYRIPFRIHEQIDGEWKWTEISSLESNGKPCHLHANGFHFDYLKP